MFVFVSTFVVFPGSFFAEDIRFLDANTTTMSYKFIVMILTFNIFDTIGRKLAGIFHLNARIIMIGALARAVFIPSTILLGL
jgi:hypothetical protein